MKPKEINCDIEDVEDVLKKIENSFNIKFEHAEMAHLKTFGEFRDHIISKIELYEIDSCTSQQAFYKLRKAIASVIGIPEKKILPSSNLNELFPHKRRRTIALIERQLNLQLKAFYVPKTIVSILLAFLFISLISFFFRWEYGVFGIVITILLMKLSDKTTTAFFNNTVGELARDMMNENYVQVRRNPESINKSEIKKTLEAMFIKHLGISEEFNELSEDTIIVN